MLSGFKILLVSALTTLRCVQNYLKKVGQPSAVPMDVDVPQPASAAAPAENGAAPRTPVKPEPSTSAPVSTVSALLRVHTPLMLCSAGKGTQTPKLTDCSLGAQAPAAATAVPGGGHGFMTQEQRPADNGVPPIKPEAKPPSADN